MEKLVFEYFMQLVQIDSESRNERKIADYLITELKKLGGEVIEDESGKSTGGNSGNIIAWFEGNKAIEPIILNAHMDTVVPGNGVKAIERDGLIISEGETILGADDKSGIAMILAYLRDRQDSGKSEVPVQVLFTISEEIGLLGAKELNTKNIRGSKGYSLDGNLLGDVVKASPTQISYKIEFRGRSVHAGVEPEKGINAIKAAAGFIEALPDGRINEKTTMNIGKICGGQATNIVCDQVFLEGEVRSHSQSDLEYCLSLIKAGVEKVKAKWKNEVNLSYEYVFKALQFGEEEEVIKISREAFEKIGIAQNMIINGGGSDANALSEKGIRLAVIGTGMQKIHTKDEFIKKSDLINGYKWLGNVISIWEKKCRI